MKASGGSLGEPDARGATSDTYVRVALVGADGSAADDEAAQSETVPKDTAEPEWEGELSLLLPENSVRPPLLRVSVWDKDWAAGTDAPLAVADVTLAAEPSGTMSTVKLPARDELGEIDISFEYEVAVAPADAAAVPPPPAAPAPREEVRVVQPSGFVVGSVVVATPSAGTKYASPLAVVPARSPAAFVDTQQPACWPLTA